MNKYILIATLVLVGCGGKDNIKEKPHEIIKSKIPADLLLECEKIDKLVSRDMGDLLIHDTNLMFRYKECSDRHKRLKEAVTEK